MFYEYKSRSECDSKQTNSSGVEERGSVWANNKLDNCYCHTSPQSTGLSEVIVVTIITAIVIFAVIVTVIQVLNYQVRRTIFNIKL